VSEATFTSKLIAWMRKRDDFPTCAFEVKLSKTKSLPFASLAEHQDRALGIARQGHLAYKIPDAGYQNPCDGVHLYRTMAYVVVAFYTPRYKTRFYCIDIKKWRKEIRYCGRASITEERAGELADFQDVI